MIRLKRSCKEIATLVIAREDRDLPLTERLALRLHMTICSACPRFERQILTMRNVMKPWQNHEAESQAEDTPQH